MFPRALPNAPPRLAPLARPALAEPGLALTGPVRPEAPLALLALLVTLLPPTESVLGEVSLPDMLVINNEALLSFSDSEV